MSLNKISRSDYEKLQEWVDNIDLMNIDDLIEFFNELKNKYDWCIHAERGRYNICNDEYQHSIDFTLQCKKENEYKYIDELYFATVYCDGSSAEDLAEMYSDVPFTTTFGDGFGDCFFQFRLCDYKYFLQQLIKHLEDFVKDGKIDSQSVYNILESYNTEFIKYCIEQFKNYEIPDWLEIDFQPYENEEHRSWFIIYIDREYTTLKQGFEKQLIMRNIKDLLNNQ